MKSVIRFIISILCFMFDIAKYINPKFLFCLVFHEVSKEEKYFMRPFGIGGGYNKIGYWCKKCEKMYCGK